MKFELSLLDNIGFNIVKDLLCNRTEFQDNKVEFSNLEPLNSIKGIEQSQKHTLEILNSFIKKEQLKIPGCTNIDDILESLKVKGIILDKEHFRELKLIFKSAEYLKKGLSKHKFPIWNDIGTNLYDFKRILREYDRIFDDEFDVKANASNQLSKIVENIKKIDRSIMSTAEKVLKK